MPSATLRGKEITNSIDVKFVLIPAGKFFMGSPIDELERDDEVRHEVEISRSFYLGIHEVTQGQYEHMMGRNPSAFSARGADKDKVVGKDTRRFPVGNVMWAETQEFCKKLSDLEEEQKHGRTYRLPTEAEWEYACLGGTSQSLPFGIGKGTSFSFDQANFNASAPYGGAPMGVALDRPCEVGSYQQPSQHESSCCNSFKNRAVE